MKFQKISKSREYVTKKGIRQNFRISISGKDANELEISDGHCVAVQLVVYPELAKKIFPFANENQKLMVICPLICGLDRKN